MKILALIGSPRKGGNTDILIDEILRSAVKNGHKAEKLYLYDYDILPCLDCCRCKRSDSNYNCALRDGMQKIYLRLEESGIIIFGTPVYWYGPTAQMKLFIDRLRPFIASRKLLGKKGLVVVPSEEGPGCCGPLMEMFNRSFDYLGMEMLGSILAKAYERGEVARSIEEMKKAIDLGATL
jgi:multimeric flavodoxin WrbA